MKRFRSVVQSAHPLPVVGGQVSNLVLRDQLLQDLGDVVEVGLVLLILHPVDQRRQLVQILLRTLVVAPQILWQLLQGEKTVNNRVSCQMLQISRFRLCEYLESLYGKPGGDDGFQEDVILPFQQ